MINKHYILTLGLFSALNIIADDCPENEEMNRKPNPVSYHISQTGSNSTASNSNPTTILQSGEDGQVLTSNGAGVTPTFQSLTANVRVFTTAGAGTYTPTSGTQYIVVEAIAGGGGSGGVAATALHQSAGGGSGSYSRRVLTAGQIGTAIAYTVGAGGTAGAAGAAGVTGSATSFGETLVTTNGGAPSPAGAATATLGGAGGALGTGGVFAGRSGQSTILGATFTTSSGAGADAPAGFGQGGYPVTLVTAAVGGIAGQGFGAGASGSTAGGTPSATAGAAGAPGAIIITEYILA